MAERPKIEFGKRSAVAPSLSPSPPVKRSHHVALLMMGTLAVGGGAYALMPRQNCQPGGPGMAAPSTPDAAGACARGSSSSGGHGGGSGGWWSHSSYYGGTSSLSATSTASGATETTRGGFGGFAHSIAAHFSGG
jgi:hypothetical protein